MTDCKKLYWYGNVANFSVGCDQGHSTAVVGCPPEKWSDAFYLIAPKQLEQQRCAASDREAEQVSEEQWKELVTKVRMKKLKSGEEI